MTDFIEKKVAEFRTVGAGSVRFIATREECNDFLRTALQEALLKGLEMSEVAVINSTNASNDQMKAVRAIRALKKEVMEGAENV